MQASAQFDTHYRSIYVKRLSIIIGLCIALILSLMLDLTAGPAQLGLTEIIKGIIDPQSLSLRHQIILWDVRLPDALIALAVGAALGLAGIETQTILNNPLASPFTLGVSALATLGASLAIVVAPVIPFLPNNAVLPAMALLFALLGGGLILAFTKFSGGARESVVLFGIALVFLANALTAALQYVASAEAVQAIVFWTIGNLTKVGWNELYIVSFVLVCVLPFSLRHVWLMTLIRGGEAQAKSLGLNVSRLRALVIFRVSILAAFAVCFVGAIGFVGLVGPHIARMLLGEDHRLLVPGSILCGALILSLASFLSKALLPGVIIPVGILTSVIGVPIFLFLISKQRKVS